MTTIENKNDIEEIDESGEENIVRPFDPKKIDITIKPLIIDSLVKRLRSEPARINLNTEFQRSTDLWDPVKQSRLIESLLVRIPLPAFYFDGTDDNLWQVVDGLQRLCTIKNFMIDKSLILKNLEFLSKYNGLGFDELPPYLQGRIEETSVTAYIINPGTPNDVKYNIFHRINTGGLTLTPQEIRHAIHHGKPAEFVMKLAKLKPFEDATASSLKDSPRMEDRDFVTRFIAFFTFGSEYSGDLLSFLSDTMEKIRKLDDAKLSEIEKAFIKSMTAAHKIFDNGAFRKKNDSGRRSPLNKALFEVWSVSLAKLSKDELNTLELRKTDLLEKFEETLLESDFQRSITTSTSGTKAVETRKRIIENIIEDTLCD